MVFSFFEKHSKLSWFIVIVGAIGIFILSSLSFRGSGGTSNLAIIYHILAYLFLTLFILIALTKGKPTLLSFLSSILIAIAYSISDEIHQFFVPGRVCGFFDIKLNTIGIALAAFIYIVRLKLKHTL